MSQCGVVATENKYGHVWKKIEQVMVDEIGCSVCLDHGLAQLQAMRDRIAYHKGSPVKDLKNLLQVATEYRCTYHKLNASKKRKQLGPVDPVFETKLKRLHRRIQRD